MAIIIGSILLDAYVFAAIFAIITGWAVREFYKLVNTQEAVEVNLWLGVGGAVLLFLTSFLHAADVIRYPVFSFYGLYIVLTLIAELYLKKKNPIHNWAYLILGQIFIALPFALLNFIAFIDADQLRALANPLVKNGYGQYLLQLLATQSDV